MIPKAQDPLAQKDLPSLAPGSARPRCRPTPGFRSLRPTAALSSLSPPVSRLRYKLDIHERRARTSSTLVGCEAG